MSWVSKKYRMIANRKSLKTAKYRQQQTDINGYTTYTYRTAIEMDVSKQSWTPNISLQSHCLQELGYFIHFWTDPQHGFSGVCTSWHHVAILVADIQTFREPAEAEFGESAPMSRFLAGVVSQLRRQAPPRVKSCNSNMFQYFPLRPGRSTPNLSVFPSFSVNIPMFFFFNGCLLHHQDFYRSLWPISCG